MVPSVAASQNGCGRVTASNTSLAARRRFPHRAGAWPSPDRSSRVPSTSPTPGGPAGTATATTVSASNAIGSVLPSCTVSPPTSTVTSPSLRTYVKRLSGVPTLARSESRVLPADLHAPGVHRRHPVPRNGRDWEPCADGSSGLHRPLFAQFFYSLLAHLSGSCFARARRLVLNRLFHPVSEQHPRSARRLVDEPGRDPNRVPPGRGPRRRDA